MSVLDSTSGEWDSDGFHFWLRNDEGEEFHVRVVGTEAAEELLAVVEPLREWVNEGARQRAAYKAASPEERAQVLGREQPDEETMERLRGYADDAIKRAKESR